MASKLKDLIISKVDFVDEGANPDAYIRIFKRNDAAENGESRDGAGSEGESIDKDISILADRVADEIGKRLERAIEKMVNASGSDGEEPANPKEDDDDKEPKGEKEEMIDKKKLTAAELAFLEDIEKRCAAKDDGAAEDGGNAEAIETAAAEGRVEKSAAEGTDNPEDIYKGIHPAVKAELEALKKFREEAEDRELMAVAKKYEITGKKAEDLVPMLKSLRNAGGTAYTDMIAVLDQTVEMIEKSGAFAEIGKSGNGAAQGSAWAEADAKAVELMKSRVGLTKAQALDEVFTQDPGLAGRCEKEG